MILRRKTTKAAPAPAPTSRITPPLEGVELPSYSAGEGTCAKCGASHADTAYHSSGRSCTHYRGGGVTTAWGQERMYRSCIVCGFSWDEQLPETHDG